MKPNSDIFKKLNFISEIKLKDEILENSKILNFKKGETIVRQGEYVKVLPLVLSGSIRVFQTKEDREILLYYVEISQTCIMALSASFYNNKSSSQGIAISDTKILAIPTPFIVRWQREFSSWNNFVIRTFRNRYDELLETFDSVVFEHIDERVLKYLKNRISKQDNSIIKISHQKLAYELGTTRVVISRILKQYELEGKLLIRRAEIELL